MPAGMGLQHLGPEPVPLLKAGRILRPVRPQIAECPPQVGIVVRIQPRAGDVHDLLAGKADRYGMRIQERLLLQKDRFMRDPAGPDVVVREKNQGRAQGHQQHGQYPLQPEPHFPSLSAASPMGSRALICRNRFFTIHHLLIVVTAAVIR